MTGWTSAFVEVVLGHWKGRCRLAAPPWGLHAAGSVRHKALRSVRAAEVEGRAGLQTPFPAAPPLLSFPLLFALGWCVLLGPEHLPLCGNVAYALSFISCLSKAGTVTLENW